MMSHNLSLFHTRLPRSFGHTACTFGITATVAFATFMAPQYAHAAPEYVPTDRGAETVIKDDPEGKLGALPIELVEEQGAPAAIGSGSRKSGVAGAKDKMLGGDPTGEDGKPKKRAVTTLALTQREKQAAAQAGQLSPTAGSTGEDGSDVGTQSIPNPEQTVTFNLPDDELESLVKAFSKLTKRNYVVDKTIKGKKVSIIQPTPITLAEAMRMFDSILLINGFTVVPIGSNTWKIVVAKDARQTTIPLLAGSERNPSDALVTQLVRLKYVPAEDLQQIFSQFVSKDGLVNAFTGTNSLIVIDSAANIERMRRIIRQLDVPAVDQDITIIPIEHADAKDVAEKLLEILGEKEADSKGGRTAAGTRSPIVTPPQPGISAASMNQGRMGDPGERRLPLKVIPDERTNSLIIVADQELTVRVRALAEQLDSEIDRSGGRFFVYRLKHADAEELAGILLQLISGSAPERSSTGATTGSSLSRNSRDNNSRSRDGSDRFGSRFQSGLGSRSRLGGAGGSGGGTGSTSGGSSSGSEGGTAEGKVALQGEVTIAPDPATNSLIINASRQDYQKIKEVIDELDVKRRQVLVEATILEVSLDKIEGFGIELQGTIGTDNGGVFAQTNYGGLSSLLQNPAALNDLSIAAASTGTITLPGGITLPSQAALLRAVSNNTNANVLSSPNILTTDNQEAEIIVGQNVPFVTSTSTDPTNLNNTFNQVERQDVGITLRITPQISTGNFVTLRIFVEISNVIQTVDRDPNGPTTNIRTTETTVEVKDNQMIITGGLISDDVTQATRGVPFFQDIPVLGNYFKREDSRRMRKNLLVFITPKILKDQFDARESTIDKRDELKHSIDEQKAEPTRDDVLLNRNIDNVAEVLPPGKVVPSTVTPPTSSTGVTVLAPQDGDANAALDRTKKRLDQLLGGPESLKPGAVREGQPSTLNSKPARTGNTSAGDTPASSFAPPSNASDEVIDLKVKPKLPGFPEEPSPAAKSSPAEVSPLVSVKPRVTERIQHSLAVQPEIRGDEPEVSPPASARAMLERPAVREGKAMVTYVVLRDVSVEQKGESPFGNGDSKSVGLLVEGGSGSAASKFFEAGGRYSYRANGIERSFVCLGRYGSINEAQVVDRSLATDAAWYRLSPYEVLALGKEHWLRG